MTTDSTGSGVRRFEPGDVFQILPEHGRAGWIGAFVLATEIKQWGIVGFVHHIADHDTYSAAYIRLKWEHIGYIGKAQCVPSSAADDDEAARTRTAPAHP